MKHVGSLRKGTELDWKKTLKIKEVKVLFTIKICLFLVELSLAGEYIAMVIQNSSCVAHITLKGILSQWFV